MIITSINYSLAYFIKYDYPNLGVFEVLRRSKQIINGHRSDFVVLNLSFTGWGILSFFTFGIGLLWLFPYMRLSTILFYNHISTEDDELLNIGISNFANPNTGDNLINQDNVENATQQSNIQDYNNADNFEDFNKLPNVNDQNN